MRLKAKDVMTPEVTTIAPSQSVKEAIALMKEKGIRGLIVTPAMAGDAYGIVTETDIVYKVRARDIDPVGVAVASIMTKPCIVVNPELSVENVAQLFANTGIRRAPVMKDDLMGVISVSDLLE